MKREYQTAGGGLFRGEKYYVIRADGKPGGTVTSNRYYLADADFLAGLEAVDDAGVVLLHEINDKLREPNWQLCLGRKACPPSVPVHLPDNESLINDRSLLDALISYPWPRLGAPLPPENRRPDRLRFVLETDYGDGPETRHDQPEGVSFSTRRFLPRSVKTIFKDLGRDIPIRKEVRHVPLPADS